MPESQPWRNPRPAPHLPEIQARLRPQRLPAWLRAWWPALVWAAVIFSMSTDTFSAAHTGSVIEPILRRLSSSLTEDQIHALHYFIRKSAHFTEYFVFCLLLFRAVRGNRQGWRWSWGLTALFYAACYSALDEIHQAFVVSRTASAWDSLLDSTGAFVAMGILWLWFWLKKMKAQAPSS